MAGAQEYRMGDTVKTCRLRACLSLAELAECLHSNGFKRWGSPQTIAAALTLLENAERWEFTADAFHPFCEACKTCLKLSHGEECALAYGAGNLVFDFHQFPRQPLVPPPDDHNH